MSKMLPTVMQAAKIRKMDVSPGQAAKMARRFEKHRAEVEAKNGSPLPRITNAQQALKYCLDYWDEVGELAIRNVQTELNHTNAARRVAA